jgi:acyl dehydratase
MTTRVARPTDLLELAADQPDLGHSGWRQITQEQVNLFADATDDHQWIHVDPDRAKAGPFGTTIAHGYLTLSLAPVFIAEILHVANIQMAMNYGLNKVRFPAPVPVGARLRVSLRLTAAQARGDAVEAVLTMTVEVEGADRPACVAEVVVLYR